MSLCAERYQSYYGFTEEYDHICIIFPLTKVLKYAPIIFHLQLRNPILAAHSVFTESVNSLLDLLAFEPFTQYSN